MPTTDLISPFVVSCAGGLTLNKDVFSMQPGEALILQNFDPILRVDIDVLVVQLYIIAQLCQKDLVTLV